jgi:DMSO/TMAO reductase YedYZ molybdopterin-dependent catalytic subunit
MRLFLPGWEGNISIKWLRRLEVSDTPFYTREETSKIHGLDHHVRQGADLHFHKIGDHLSLRRDEPCRDLDFTRSPVSLGLVAMLVMPRRSEIGTIGEHLPREGRSPPCYNTTQEQVPQYIFTGTPPQRRLWVIEPFSVSWHRLRSWPSRNRKGERNEAFFRDRSVTGGVRV